MNRAAILAISTAFFAGITVAAPASASDSPDPFAYISANAPGFDEYQSLIERLDEEGAEILVIERTFLGRLRIVSTLNGKVREVVISPNTGEIRRDIIIGDYNPADYASSLSNGKSPGKGKGNNNGRGGGSGGGGGNGGGKGRNK